MRKQTLRGPEMGTENDLKGFSKTNQEDTSARAPAAEYGRKEGKLNWVWVIWERP